MADREISREEWQALFDRYSVAHTEVQSDYDSTLRALAGGGVAVTLTVATFLEEFTATGFLAVGLFLASLLIHLVSYETAERDLTKRGKQALSRDMAAWNWNRWTHATAWLNRLAGGLLILGGVLLLLFVQSAT